MEVKATLNDIRHEMMSRGLLEKEKHYWLDYKNRKVYIEDIDDYYLTNIYNFILKDIKKKEEEAKKKEEEAKRKQEYDKDWDEYVDILDEAGGFDPFWDMDPNE